MSTLAKLKHDLLTMEPNAHDGVMAGVMEQFFDLSEQHLAPDGPPWGMPVAAVELMKIVCSIATKITGQATIGEGVFFRLSELGGFVHGSVGFGPLDTDYKAVVFWFDDPGVGLLGIAVPPSGMHFARFRPVACPQGQVAGRN